jgi:hypothetical protein
MTINYKKKENLRTLSGWAKVPVQALALVSHKRTLLSQLPVAIRFNSPQ